MHAAPDATGPLTTTRVAEVRAGLRAPRAERFEDAVRTAVEMGEDGDRLLAEVDDLTGWRRVFVVAALGDVRGPAGGAVLHRAIRLPGPGTSDLRCAAALALAKRNEPGATPALADLVHDRDPAVRDYALFGLAAVGDNSAYHAVLARVTAMLARRRTAESADLSPLTLAVIYLLRHAEQRAPDLAALLRLRWQRMTPSEQGWFSEHWPGLRASDDSAPLQIPDAQALQSQLLAEPLYATPAVQ